MSPVPKKIATINLVDEVSAIISGLRIADLESLHDAYGLYSKNYFFNPRFKLRRWDGKIRFFTKGGKTYIQLLPDIIKSLTEWGYEIKLKDDRCPFSMDLDPVDKDYFADYGWELGEHQVKAVNSVFEHNNGIIRVGTGGGKTLITGVICDAYVKKGMKLIVIVPTKDLVQQTAKEIGDFDFSVGLYYGLKKETDKDVIVSTWQTLNNERSILTMFEGIIVDECHGTNAETKLADLLGKEGRNHPVRIGLTGSLPDYHTNRMTLFCHLGPVRAVVPASELIDKGWLSQLNLIMYEFKEDFKQDYKEYVDSLPDDDDNKDITYTRFKNEIIFPTYDTEKRYLNSYVERLEVIAQAINILTEQHGNTFILVNTVEIAKKVTKILGDDTIFISSKIKDRSEIYDMFKTATGMKAVTTFSLASTGLNIPRIFNLVTIDLSKSFTRIVQSIGRSLRKADDKDMANVLDFYSDSKYAKRHSAKRKKIYKKENYPFRLCKVDYKSPDCVEKIVKEVNKVAKEKLKNEVFE